MYTITLSSGEKIDGFTLKNNCLVSRNGITPAMFSGKLSPVTISGTKGENDDEDFGGLVGTHEHMKVVYVKNTEGGSKLALCDIPKSESISGYVSIIDILINNTVIFGGKAKIKK